MLFIEMESDDVLTKERHNARGKWLPASTKRLRKSRACRPMWRIYNILDGGVWCGESVSLESEGQLSSICSTSRQGTEGGSKIEMALIGHGVLRRSVPESMQEQSRIDQPVEGVGVVRARASQKKASPAVQMEFSGTRKTDNRLRLEPTRMQLLQGLSKALAVEVASIEVSDATIVDIPFQIGASVLLWPR